ncbi:MAG TPA: hypothetical protein VGR47_00740 [Terracidiphilus sp.]|nr:hypothetical protein [Terracidiphilus sp.]
MRFFNIDLHIGVIGDIKRILHALGHDVTDWTLSSHAWVIGRTPHRVEIVNETTWREIDRSMCDAFYKRYKSEFEQYDAFIVTHTPSFAMLYERWGKPVICVASTRYEAPFYSDRKKWEEFNNYLRRQIDCGMLIPIANNKYDSAYAEYFTGRKWKVIPSLCEYTNAHYSGKRSDSLYFSKFPLQRAIPGLVSKEAHFKPGLFRRAAGKLGFKMGRRGYSWDEIASFGSVVYVPYNASIMSIFEMYASGIPMLFPSLPFALELYAEHRQEGVFSELSYNQIYHLPPRSAIPSDSLDPNNYENSDAMAHWIAKSDFYDADNLKHLVYFDSFDELAELLDRMDPEQIHHQMREHQRLRSARSHEMWANVVQNLVAVGAGVS